MSGQQQIAPRMRVDDCRYCTGLVFRDRDGRHVHTSLEYLCRDWWGLPAATYAEPRPEVVWGWPPEHWTSQ